jgi:hypothetical protein
MQHLRARTKAFDMVGISVCTSLQAGNDITVIALWLGHFSGVPKLCRSVARRPFFSEE